MIKYHMKKFLTSLALFAVISTVSAQSRTLNKPVVCDATETVFKTIIEEFKETPQWRGQNPQQGTSVVLTVNLTTGAWTLVEYTSITACVIAVGENSSSAWGVSVKLQVR
jgi:ribose/xylose/arabinose/galactoside ABC-type transport system permease subunit